MTNDEINLLKKHIRRATSEDEKKLPKFSYSKIEQFLNCPLAYNFKYNQKMSTTDTSLALELGSLLHGILEKKGYMLRETGCVDFELLDKLIYGGIIETNKRADKEILGITALKKKYWEIWSIPDSEGRTYDEKLKLFDRVLHSEMQNDDWKPFAFEMPFEYVWDDKVILHGFIDRIDEKEEGATKIFRTIDYKSSKKIFANSKLPTSLQFVIYAFAIFAYFGTLPSESVYKFILLDEKQEALTNGWVKRAVKKLTQTFDAIEKRDEESRFEPKPSPLCRWCNYSVTNPDAHDYKDMCEYYSLWTPENKTFEKNKEWNALENKEPIETKRKLIF